MVLRKCCVGGCTATSETHQLFSIPKNDNLRALWLTFLVPTNPHLTGLTKSQLVDKKVCSKHFDEQQFDIEGRRLRYSYPSLFADLEIALGEPRSKTEWTMLNEHNYFIKQSGIHILEPALNIVKTADTYSDLPSCSFTRSYEEGQLSKQISFHSQSENYCTKSALEVQTPGDIVCEQPSCSFTTTDVEKPNTIPVIERKVLIKRKTVLKKRKLIKRIITISGRSLGDSAVQRLQQAQDVIASPAIIEKFYALSKHAQTFIKMQLKHVNKNKMARRFTFDEKVLALSLIKQSPKGYKLLEKMFMLPNKNKKLSK